MFSALLDRFRRKPAAPRAAAALSPRPAAALAARSAAPAPSAAATPCTGAGARRPLVSAQGRLAAFEFQIGPALLSRLRGPAALASTGNLLGAMRLCCSQGLGTLAALPASWLAPAALDAHFAPGMHLLLQPDALFDDAPATCLLVSRLRRAGVRVGWAAQSTPPMPRAAGRPDFMPLPPPAAPGACAWRQAVEAAAQRWPGVPLLLLELPSVDALEAALAPGVLWAACHIGGCVEPPRAQALPPQAQRALQLLNRLLNDDDHAAVVDAIKADAALSVRLLQYLNSAGALPDRELDSIEQAVMLLGRDALYRWVAQMLVRMSPPRPAAHALQATALARARLFELLARAAQAPNPGALYLLGLATMLPLLLQCDIDAAVDALRLPAPAALALRAQGGPWLPYLQLLQALEAADLPVIEALAGPFGGSDHVLASWAEAWHKV
ncbi:MAG TPA: HDOD domain-containing protein [Rubrivivax sp.]|nr:HDOD domain-containing protein [Rubrivivax sp.]HPO18291.1 HDOD domain-containing protein [Rubrivivax sp.]